MWTKLKSWWRAEGDLAQIRGLGDRLLADMGLERSNLGDLVHGRAKPEPEPQDCTRHPLRRPLTTQGKRVDVAPS